jgi:hypothetical protein
MIFRARQKKEPGYMQEKGKNPQDTVHRIPASDGENRAGDTGDRQIVERNLYARGSHQPGYLPQI